MDWEDLRAFLAVARLGSLRRAAGVLGVTQPTAARRIRKLESDLGLALFARDRDGHRLTAAGARLLPEARAVETTALRVERRSRDLVGGLADVVRVGAMESAAAVLARGLGRLVGGPRIELVIAGEAGVGPTRSPEVTVRHGLPPDGDGLTWRVGSIGCAVYGAPAFAEDRALPLEPDDLAALPWLAFATEQEHYVTMRWISARLRGRAPAARLTRMDMLAAAAAAGVGVAVLPCFIGDTAPGVLRLSAPIEELRADYWAVAHEELARNPSVRAVTAWIADCFRAAELGAANVDRPPAALV